jgi:exodeoxyribonuclease-3
VPDRSRHVDGDGRTIFYQISTRHIAAKAVKASIYKTRRFGDHAPLSIDYDWNL